MYPSFALDFNLRRYIVGQDTAFTFAKLAYASLAGAHTPPLFSST